MRISVYRFGSVFVLTIICFCVSQMVSATAQEGTAQERAAKDATKGKERPAIVRAKKQAKMLDTLYKTAIVLITENYVDGSEDLAAGDAFQALFKSMKDNGFHEVRLLDATGDAYDTDNEPKTDFEKEAIKTLLDGKPIYEKIVKEGEKRYLLSATPIPVVMEKCTLCHSNYEGVEGPIGSLALKIPLD